MYIYYRMDDQQPNLEGGFFMSKRKLTLKQEYELKDKYENGISVCDLMYMYGFKTKKSIYDIVKRRGGKTFNLQESIEAKNPKRKISFKTIDTPFKAYFIGLMLTDGWVTSRNMIGISMTDKDVVDFICDAFGKESRIIKKPGNRKLQYRFSINSERIVNELKRFGIVERKSLTLQPPKIKKYEVEFIPYLIRGIIDGDGWIRKDGKEFFICSMSKDFILWCKKVLENHFKFVPLNLKQGSNNIWYLRSSDERNMMLLYAHIYYDQFGMSRKRNKLLKRFRDYNGRG